MDQRTPETGEHSHTVVASVGAHLRAARLARGLSQEALAAPEFTKSYVSAIERGKARPSLKALDLLARRLDVPIATLLVAETPLAGEPPLVSALDHIEQLLYTDRPESAQAVLAAIPTDAAGFPAAPPPLQGRFYRLQGITWLRQGRAGAAATAFQTALTLVPPGSLAAIALTDLLGLTYFVQQAHALALEQHETCWQQLARYPDAPAGLLLQVASHLVQVYAAADHDPQTLALVQTLQPRLDDLTTPTMQAATWPPLCLPPEGADGPAAPALALYAFTASVGSAVRVLITGARVAARQQRLETARAWCDQAQRYATSLRHSVLHSEITTLQATLALAAQDTAAAVALLATALRDLEAYGGARPGPGVDPALPPVYLQALILAGQVAEHQARQEQADHRFTQALAWAAGDATATGWVAREYAEILQARGAAEQATQYYRLACQPGRRSAVRPVL